MQKLAKGFLVALGVVLALAALGIIAINLYVQSARTQARIEAELSAALRMPVRMTGVTLTPWNGLKIKGIAIQQPDASGNFLEASSFTAFFEWAPLLRHRLVINEININDPKVTWTQSENGKWQLPNESPADEVPAQPGEPQDKQSKATDETEPKPDESREKRKPLQIVINQFHINRGAFAFLDERANPVVIFSEVEVNAPYVSADTTQGDATSGRVSVRDKVFFEHVRIPFSYASGDLNLHDVEGDLASGKLRGNVRMQTEQKRSPFTADIRFEQVDVNRLLTDAGALPGRATGLLSGWLNLYGNAAKPESFGGKGQLTMTGGQIRQYEFLQLLGRALRIDELSQLTLKQAQADYHVADGSVLLDRLVLQSQNLQLQANGSIKLDGGKLRLDARLTVNDRISRQLPAFIEANFQPDEAQPALRSIDFKVNGTINKPQTNLMERILGRRIEKEMTSLFQDIFSKPGKKKDKKKSDLPAASNPGSAASPTLAE